MKRNHIKPNRRIILSLALLASSTFWLQPSISLAQETAFNYQGRLDDSGSPANGIYDLRFTIYDALSGGSAVRGSLTNAAIPVTNGWFSVILDFGAGVFTGPGRWLQLEVKTNGGGAFSTLAPRQPCLPAPYAVMANTASNLLGTFPAAKLTGAIGAAQLPAGVLTNGESDAVLMGAFSGDGSRLANLSGANIQPGTVSSTDMDSAVQEKLAEAGGVENGRTLTNVTLTASNALPVSVIGGKAYPGGTVTLWTVPGSSASTTNRMFLVMSNTTQQSGVLFFGPGVGSGGLTFWPDHGHEGGAYSNPATFNSPEVLVQSSGSLCLDWGTDNNNRALQLGLGAYRNLFVYLQGVQAAGGLPWNTSCYHAVPLLARPYYSLDGGLTFTAARRRR